MTSIHSLWHLNPWFPVRGIVWGQGRFRCFSLARGGGKSPRVGLESKIASPTSSLLSLLCSANAVQGETSVPGANHRDHSLLPCCLPIMESQSPWTVSQNKLLQELALVTAFYHSKRKITYAYSVYICIQICVYARVCTQIHRRWMKTFLKHPPSMVLHKHRRLALWLSCLGIVGTPSSPKDLATGTSASTFGSWHRIGIISINN